MHSYLGESVRSMQWSMFPSKTISHRSLSSPSDNWTQCSWTMLSKSASSGLWMITCLKLPWFIVQLVLSLTDSLILCLEKCGEDYLSQTRKDDTIESLTRCCLSQLSGLLDNCHCILIGHHLKLLEPRGDSLIHLQVFLSTVKSTLVFHAWYFPNNNNGFCSRSWIIQKDKSNLDVKSQIQSEKQTSLNLL